MVWFLTYGSRECELLSFDTLFYTEQVRRESNSKKSSTLSLGNASEFLPLASMKTALPNPVTGQMMSSWRKPVRLLLSFSSVVCPASLSYHWICYHWIFNSSHSISQIFPKQQKQNNVADSKSNKYGMRTLFVCNGRRWHWSCAHR